MLSVPAIQNLRDKLISAAETVLRSKDKEVVDLIYILESQMTTTMKEQYKHYREIESEYINMYHHLQEEYYYKSSCKFSINKINDDLKAYDQAYKDCQKFINIYKEIMIEANKCNLLDQENENITNDHKAHEKYETWFNQVSEFQDQIYNEIQDQINQQIDQYNKIVELIKNKLQIIEEDEE